MQTVLASILSAAAAYLLGSVSFAIVVSKSLYHQDVRQFGSGNAGMTNILRTYGKKAAALTLAGDFLKGVAAVLISRLIFAAMGVTLFDGAYVGGLFAILGHLYPVYFGFRGGKGILTSIGIIAVINPLVFLGLLIIGLPLIFLTKIVSVGSLAGAVCYPFLTLLVDFWQGGVSWLDFSFSLVIALLVIWMHRSNIKRLLNGTENRFGSKKTSSEEKK
ncbi:MAG TPA: acyl-phosphate glycerol 3-phosphate acyltransferase [Ruminococcaceae bacterium]|nr:acyl-phosphate glycerol 3-phosphate acyltransferase [Oscillospiraceae bacterium]HAO69809.1 acyl-phosphate glycerol 3-phosphate acyltransferase [Oscillospiraceae bacterium]